MKKRRTFRTERELFHADTCEPLKNAAACGDLRLHALGQGAYPGGRLPRHDFKELLSVGSWNAATDQSWGLDWHCNEGIEIGYLYAGRIPFATDDGAFEVGPGHLTITRPWQRHRVGQPMVPASHYSWIILDVGVRRPNQVWRWPKWLLAPEKVRRSLTAQLSHNERPVWRANQSIAACFRKLDAAVALGAGGANRAMLKVVISELLLLLAGLLESRNPRLDTSVPGSERTVRWFLANLPRRLDEPWSLDTMAAACGIGRTHFASCCRKIVNCPPVEYLIRCRLDAAAAMLRAEPAIRITEIAFRCGFHSSQYFASAFRKRFGCSPGEARSRPVQPGIR
ncbi:MAG: AraC family transcriptional regulator [Chthoniobacterales bacterium]|nr:AraC family transcriptional regulator [Chthoniobacterales bacterium]